MHERQGGAFHTDQLLAAGFTRAHIRAQVAARRWQRVHPRVHALFTGPLPRETQLWAAVLYAGEGAVLSHKSAAEVWGLEENTTGPIHVTIAHSRRAAKQPGLHIHRSRSLDKARHPTKTPPVTRVEDTVADLIAKAKSPDEVVTWLTRAVQRRRTTPHRLRAALDARPRQPWRDLATKILADVAGAETPLELEYVNRVERPHGLPTAKRQRRITAAHWADAVYEPYRLVVELDGRLGHLEEGAFRDHRRDNTSTEKGFDTLRYGWGDVVTNSCAVAQQIASVLSRHGWRGAPRRCGGACAIERAAA